MYDETTRNRAIELVQQGMSCREASAAMGGKPTAGAIRLWVNGRIPTQRRRRQTLVSAEEKLEAIRRVEAGEHYRDVAADYGCTPTAVLQWRRRYVEDGEDGLYTRVDKYFERRGGR